MRRDSRREDDEDPLAQQLQEHNFLQTFMGVIGNVLEWYDFAVFGYLSDVLGEVFFPPQANHSATVESLAVFGGAFLMRPVGGLLLGYLGDTYGRDKALVWSIFLMAGPTFLMGCLPSYDQVGSIAIVLLIVVRCLQGLSVGGQLVSSLVYTLERQDPSKWGLYGSFVMAAANFGTLLGGLIGMALRTKLSHEQLVAWGWRLPFLSGIIVSFSGCYLRSHGESHHVVESAAEGVSRTGPNGTSEEPPPRVNPLREAFKKGNRRSLAAAAMVPMLWAAGFYMSFVWMAIYMADLLDDPVPHAFAVNSGALLLSVCILFPIAGILSDRFGRKRIMVIGGVGMAVLSPILIIVIGKGDPLLAFCAQSLMGISLSFWGSPMCAWLVEAFSPEARLTSVAIGYNVAQAFAGGLTPALATLMVDDVGVNSPGLILTILAATSLTGLLVVAPESSTVRVTATNFAAVPTHSELELPARDGELT